MRWICCWLLLSVSSAAVSAASVDTATRNKIDFEFSAIEHLVEQEIGKIIIAEIYQELGLNIAIKSFSGNRAQHEANSGLKAGETMRIWSYGNENENLIRVPTPYYRIITTAFTSKNSAINITKASDLKHHKIVRVRGVKHTNNITKGLAQVSDSSSTERMFKLLQQGHVDVALTSYIDGMHVIRQLKLENEIIASPPLAQLQLYHYLHKDHEALVSQVDDKINQLKNNGKLAEIIKVAEYKVLKANTAL